MSSSTTSAPASPGSRTARWAVLPVLFVGTYAYWVLHGLAFRVHNYDSSSVGSDVALAGIASVVGLAVVAGVLALVRRRGPRASARAGAALGLVAAAIYPVVYYLPWSLMWGVAALLLAQDGDPGRVRTAARLLGALAVLEVVVTTVAWLLGSGWHPGCAAVDCHPR